MDYAAIVRIIADGAVLPVIVLGAVGLVLFVPNTSKIRVYSRILVAGLTAYLVAKLMATLYQPTGMRPFELANVQPGAAYLNNPGFPSDHMLFVMAITYAVWYGTRRKWLIVSCLILALLVGIGRVLALVHTPLDVLGGAFAASIGALWYLEMKNNKIHLQKH